MNVNHGWQQSKAEKTLERRKFSQNLRKAETSLKNGSASEARSIVVELLKRDPNHVGALEVLARAQWTLGLNAPLLDTLDQLMRSNPYEPGYHMLRGAALRNLGRYGESLRSFVRAGDASGAKESVEELSAIQYELVLNLLKEDRIFRAAYGQDPERACAERGFEFGSGSKIRNWVIQNEYSSARVSQRPS